MLKGESSFSVLLSEGLSVLSFFFGEALKKASICRVGFVVVVLLVLLCCLGFCV